MNIYSILKSASVCDSYTPEAKGNRRCPSSRGARHNMKEMKELILITELPEEEKQTALQRPFNAFPVAADVYFIACRYSPFSFL